MKRLALVLLTLLAACEEPPAAPPPPASLTQEAVGHYCGMTVAAHAGPKGQIHVAGRAQPYWFTSVRDTKAFTLLPEEPKDLAAIYVTDMSGVRNWREPGPWIDARQAHYVIGSSQTGGMGAPEAVPFSDRTAAEAFAAGHGGRIVGWAAIPADYVLGPAESPHGH